MEHKLDEIIERQIRLETAQEYRFQMLSGQLQHILYAQQQLLRPHSNGNGNGGNSALLSLVKGSLAMLLPAAVFLLVLALTGDFRAALLAAKGG
jgi:hypothetical protein